MLVEAARRLVSCWAFADRASLPAKLTVVVVLVRWFVRLTSESLRNHLAGKDSLELRASEHLAQATSLTINRGALVLQKALSRRGQTQVSFPFTYSIDDASPWEKRLDRDLTPFFFGLRKLAWVYRILNGTVRSRRRQWSNRAQSRIVRYSRLGVLSLPNEVRN